MDNITVFAIRNIIFTGVLYLLWRIFAGFRGQWSFGRFYLLATVALSVPMALGLPDTGFLPVRTVSLPAVDVAGFDRINTVAVSAGSFDVVKTVYWTVAGLLLAVLVLRIFYIVRLKSKCTRKEAGAGYQVFYCEKITAPVSFYRWIFLPAGIDQKSKELIIKHELAHIRQKHTADLIIMEAAVALLWFNPVVYVIRRDLKLLHEVLADQNALKYSDVGSYLKLLTGIMFPGKLAIYNTFYTKQIKKRITMITQKTNVSKLTAIAVTLVALLFTAVFPAFSQQPQQAAAPSNYVVDRQPEFPGGNQALARFISEHIQYPEQARKNGIQGTVIVRFLVDENGKVRNPQVMSGVSPVLDEEALRVVSLLPDFKPAEYQGKPAKYYLTLPIVFRLDDK